MQFYIALFFFVLSLNSYSHEVAKQYELFKKGQYDQVVKNITSHQDSHKDDFKMTVLLAKSYFKLERYRKSLKYYDRIFRHKNYNEIPVESYYEFAQINYALDNLTMAKNFFEKSLVAKYNENLSLYYIGIILHSENNVKDAHRYYSRIIKSRSKTPEDIEVKQAAYAQKAELRLNAYQKKLGGKDFKIVIDDIDGEVRDYRLIQQAKQKIKDRVIKLFERGIQINPQGNLVPTMKKRISEITQKYELDVQRMINGQFIRNTNLMLRLNSIFGYDSNVVAVSDESPTQPIRKDSYTGQLIAYARKKYTVKGRYFINPELTANYQYYFERDVPDIIDNDNVTITPAVRMTREHSYNGKPASTLLDFEYSWNYRDYNQVEKLQFYNRAYTVSVGERLSFFETGESTMRLKFKDNTNQDSRFDSNTITAQFSQFFNLKSGNRYILVANFALTDSKTDSLDTDSLSLINNYIFFPKNKEYITFYTAGFNLIATDYKDPTTANERGTELLLVPSFAATKIINRNSKLTAKYAFTQSISKDQETYTYDKHVITLDFAYTF